VRIEFALTTAMEVSHYAPIARALMELGAEVNFAVSGTRAVGWDDPDDIKRTLCGLSFTTFANLDADVAITIQSAEFLRYYHGLKVRFMYGVGLVAPEHKQPIDRRYSFDYYLVPGPFSVRVQFTEHSLPSPLLPPERVKIIGYPRFDAWWNGDHEWTDATRFDLKPVLLWLPTWGAASSIPRFIDAIAALSDRYEIWVKPHHGTASHEPLRMNMLANAPMKVIDYTEPPERSFAVASVVLADLASGAFTESLFLGKSLLGLCDQDDIMRRLIDRDILKAVAVCAHGDILAHSIEALRMINPAKHQAFVSDLFDSTRGHDGERAARAIMECVG
jgi:hypothetical protein